MELAENQSTHFGKIHANYLKMGTFTNMRRHSAVSAGYAMLVTINKHWVMVDETLYDSGSHSLCVTLKWSPGGKIPI